MLENMVELVGLEPSSLIVANDALSQLSYSPLCGWVCRLPEYFISDPESAPTDTPFVPFRASPDGHPSQNPLDEFPPSTSN